MCCEDDHVVPLDGWVAMIEVEYHYVGFAAVDAGMSAKVLADQGLVLVPISANPCDFLPDVGVSVSQVVLTTVVCVTSTTAPLPCSLRFVVERERIDWLYESAVIATLRLVRFRKTRHEDPLRSGSALRSA